MFIKSFFPNLAEEHQRLMFQQSQKKELKRGDIVYRMGDEPRGIFFVEKGLVGLTILGPTSGKEHLLRFFKSGQFFGHRSLFSKEKYHGTAIVLEPTILWMVPRETIEGVLLHHPEIYKDILSVVAQELRRAEEQHIMILENQILPRVAQAIVYLKDLHPEHNWTRQEIANFCASTVSTVIKTLAELEGLRLVRQQGRAIEILDREALISLQDKIGY